MENKILRYVKQREPTSFSGRGTRKFSQEQIDFIIALRSEGESMRKVAEEFNKSFNSNISFSQVGRVFKHPERYVIGYIKPKSEYRSLKINV